MKPRNNVRRQLVKELLEKGNRYTEVSRALNISKDLTHYYVRTLALLTKPLYKRPKKGGE